MAITIVTPKNTRIAFPELFVPRPATAEIDANKYTVMVLIPKTEKDTIAKIQAGIKEALATKFKKEPVDWNTPLKDGDKYYQNKVDSADPADEEAAKKTYDYYRGHYYLNLKSNDQPKVVDRGLQPVLDAGLVKSGDYAVVSFNLSAYDTAGNKGVGSYINVVQWVKTGDSIGGGNAMSGLVALDDEDEEAFA